ncbi:MAG: transposase, partial [Actinomycetota bacterium]|nr:transposase [Actinomycetota bacterium]
MVDHRESLAAERTRTIARLRWHLHELDPGWEPTARGLDRPSAYDAVEQHLRDRSGAVARLVRRLVERCRGVSAEIEQ